MIDKKEKERRMIFAREEAAKAWCGEKTEGLSMMPDLAEEFAKILVVHIYAPHLGCATTEMLIDEIKVRIEVDGKLQYKTLPDKER